MPARIGFRSTYATHRGLELFGQQAGRLKEPGYREFNKQYGLMKPTQFQGCGRWEGWELAKIM